MKLILCFVIVSLIQFSNGSFPQNGIIAGGLATKLYSNGLPYQSYVGFASSVPIWNDYGTYFEAPCTQHLTEEIVSDFRRNIFKFITLFFKSSAVLSEGHFVISPHTAWLSLAALAEGTEGPTRHELFRILDLPEDICLRQTFYSLATFRKHPSNDVILARNRLFITDSSLRVNTKWEHIARSCTHLNTVSIPFKTNLAEIETLKRIFNAQLLNLNVTGNSFLLESLDYHGLWSSAFSDAVVETGPFYDTVGEEIGTIEYMKTMKQVNIAYVPSVNMKIIEIPVGIEEHYKMLVAVPLGMEEHARHLNTFKDDLVFEALSNMRPTPAPIEIVIPRLTMTSEIDIRKVLADLDINKLWTDSSATRNISSPAALPSSFVQRVTVTMDNAGVRPPIQSYYNIVPGVQNDEQEANSESLKSFVAKRPFIFGIFDSELYIPMFTATFSKPSV